MRRYLVTGCAGFIGSHLTDALLDRGAEVVGVDCFSDYYARELKERNLATAQAMPNFTFVEADLAVEPPAPLVDGVDGIFHLAAQPGVRGSWGAAFQTHLRDNLLVTQRLAEAAAAAGVRLVLASSSSVYGNARDYPTAEDATRLPISPYGVTKLACEQLVAAYAASTGLDAVSLRYFTVYGPRQRPDMAFARMIATLTSGGSAFELLGDGRQSRDATYVTDAVAATILAYERAPGGGVYNVGGGTEATVLETIGLLQRLTGHELRTRSRLAARGDVRRTRADTTRIRSELGWTPGVSLEEGLGAQLAASLSIHEQLARSLELA